MGTLVAAFDSLQGLRLSMLMERRSLQLRQPLMRLIGCWLVQTHAIE